MPLGGKKSLHSSPGSFKHRFGFVWRVKSVPDITVLRRGIEEWFLVKAVVYGGG